MSDTIQSQLSEGVYLVRIIKPSDDHHNKIVAVISVKEVPGQGRVEYWDVVASVGDVAAETHYYPFDMTRLGNRSNSTYVDFRWDDGGGYPGSGQPILQPPAWPSSPAPEPGTRFARWLNVGVPLGHSP